MEHLSDASFLGKLLVLPANVRLDLKVIARYEHSSLFGLIISDDNKKFNNIDTRTASLRASRTKSEVLMRSGVGVVVIGWWWIVSDEIFLIILKFTKYFNWSLTLWVQCYTAFLSV